MISLQTNITSLIAQQNLNTNQSFEGSTIQQLTSGYRINSSGDDAAGLAVANQYRSDIAELTQGVQNANNGVSNSQNHRRRVRQHFSNAGSNEDTGH